ncbi:hypothetical protein NKR19_g8426 [Coniochaeta hoffmannii]|uniref:Uncharacterized protein n=1 Tax=Coniochaeta hoffmannii TaxID=91930 RepID=A0AA38VJF3_9PEZI|nr:hypothetical protein NKR19_g8426 [Coniochaeta hoffmannii]
MTGVREESGPGDSPAPEPAYYDIASVHIEFLTKVNLITFFKHYIRPPSRQLSKLAVYLVTQAKSDLSTKQISELIKTLSLDATPATRGVTDLQARSSAVSYDEKKELDRLGSYLRHNLNVAGNKIDVQDELSDLGPPLWT